MSLFNTMVNAIRAHWSEHNNSYPQCIELDAASLKDFIETRKVVRKGLGSPPSTEAVPTLLGVKLVLGDSNALVAKDGARVPLVL